MHIDPLHTVPDGLVRGMNDHTGNRLVRHGNFVGRGGRNGAGGVLTAGGDGV